MNVSTSSSGNARTSRARTRRRTGYAEEMKNAKNCINHQEGTSETTNVMPSHVVDFTKILILCRLGVDSYVKFLNKLTLAARREKKSFSGAGRGRVENFRGWGSHLRRGGGEPCIPVGMPLKMSISWVEAQKERICRKSSPTPHGRQHFQCKNKHIWY